MCRMARRGESGAALPVGSASITGPRRTAQLRNERTSLGPSWMRFLMLAESCCGGESNEDFTAAAQHCRNGSIEPPRHSMQTQWGFLAPTPFGHSVVLASSSSVNADRSGASVGCVPWNPPTPSPPPEQHSEVRTAVVEVPAVQGSVCDSRARV